MTSETEADGSQTTWAYDNSDRLATEAIADAAINHNAAYQYDSNGNRIAMSSDGIQTSYSYNGMDQLTAAGLSAFTYDGRGNLESVTTGTQTTRYIYDSFNRLTQVTTPDGTTTSYTYDYDGRRVSKQTGGQISRYLWDESTTFGDLLLETDGAGNEKSSYVIDGFEILSERVANNVLTPIQDGLGNVRGAVDSQGNLSGQVRFDAFGGQVGLGGAGSGLYGYRAQITDPETGLQYLRSRMYSPILGRFITRDRSLFSLEFPQDFNRYLYAASNPIQYFDPSGNEPIIGYALLQANTPAEKAVAYQNARLGAGDADAISYAVYRTEALALTLVINRLFNNSGVEPYLGGRDFPSQTQVPWWIRKTNIAVDLSWFLGDNANRKLSNLSVAQKAAQADNFIKGITARQVAMPTSQTGRNHWTDVVASALMYGEQRFDAPDGLAGHAEMILIGATPPGNRIFGLASWRPFCTGTNGCLPAVIRFSDKWQPVW